MRRVLPVLLSAGLAACQMSPVLVPVRITSSPQPASCVMDRAGVRIGSVATPGEIAVPAMDGTLSVTCSKPGYVTAVQDRTPAYSPGATAYVGPGGLLALAISAAAPPQPKSDWHYPAEIHVDLLPVGDPGHALPLSGLRLQ